MALGGVRGTERVPFYNGDQKEEPNDVGSLPAINAMGHALENDLGDERERHAGRLRRCFGVRIENEKGPGGSSSCKSQRCMNTKEQAGVEIACLVL